MSLVSFTILFIMENAKDIAKSLEPKNFIEEIIIDDLKSGRVKEIVTRFPPEPNGYLHIGHAKAICLNFTTAAKFGGKCNLRFDDTNPVKEDIEYVESIQEDIQWLGFQWDGLFYAADYFDKMYDCAVKLIKKGKAYVCELTAEEMREYRGTLKEGGKNSPWREREANENLKLFKEMREGKHPDGKYTLRAKIDMDSPNINMRDPVIYRSLKASHHRTGDKWCIYPMYDYAHPLEDAFEGITHSICTLEFEDHRPFYDWVINETGFKKPPHQYEFARLNITRTIMSKRYLKKLVDDGAADGWDDPRMPTIAGMRRRGYPAAAIRDFCSRVGVAKANSEVDAGLLEHCVRENLNMTAARAMVVSDPIKVVITNYPTDKTEEVFIDNNPNDESAGKHLAVFAREIYIERDDFSLNPPPKYHRLTKGGMVRLKGAYIIRCSEVITDKNGVFKELHCEYIPGTMSGQDSSGIKVKGVIHWAAASAAVDITLKQYDYLLKADDGEGKDFSDRLNPDSLKILKAKAEPFALSGGTFQFIRLGYYCADKKSTPENPVFNLIVSLKDSYKG